MDAILLVLWLQMHIAVALNLWVDIVIHIILLFYL